jgi:hypothetical protein
MWTTWPLPRSFDVERIRSQDHRRTTACDELRSHLIVLMCFSGVVGTKKSLKPLGSEVCVAASMNRKYDISGTLYLSFYQDCNGILRGSHMFGR